MTENIDIMVSIVTILAVVCGVCYNLRERVSWLRGIWIGLAALVSVIGLYVIVLLAIALFPGLDQKSTSNDKLQDMAGSSTTPADSAEIAPITQTETRERTIDFGETNDHCASAKPVRWPFLAEEGWEIDVSSITVKPVVQSSKSSFSGVKDATKHGFYVVGRIVNSGSCVKVFGKVVTKDGRGKLHVSGSYRETRTVLRERTSG